MMKTTRYIPKPRHVPGRIILGLLKWPFEKREYIQQGALLYYSLRYKKWLEVADLFKSDGATWAPNLGLGWLFHDWMFKFGKWKDGTPITWRQANHVMLDIMKAEGWPKWVRKLYWRGVQSKFSRQAWADHRKKS